MASKLLKQISVASYDKNEPKLHSSPVETQKSSTQKASFSLSNLSYELSTSITSLRPPTSYVVSERRTQQYELKRDDVVNSNVDLQQSSQTNVYKFQTGISPQEPVIISTSEFLPIFEGGLLNSTGQSLSLKESSKHVTAKVSSVVASNFPTVNTKVLSSKLNIEEKLRGENSFVKGLLESNNTAINSLDIKSYELPWAKTFAFPGLVDTSGEFPTILDVLKKSGYSTDSIQNFSRTKMWQQSLIELKRHYSTHSSNFVSINSSVGKGQNSNEKYKLSVELPEGYRNVWINTFSSNIPSVTDLTSPTKVDDNVSIFTSFSENLYVNIGSGNQTSPNPVDISSFKYGRDISVAANVLFKEIRYSLLLNQGEIDLSSYGYTLKKGIGQENFQVWDNVIGRFTNSVLDFSENPAGNGSSLSSFSSQIFSTNGQLNQVLTLENDFIEESNCTPGSFYYIDSSLSTEDGQGFSLNRLNTLLTLTAGATNTCAKLIKFNGYDTRVDSNLGYYGISETYVKRAVQKELDLAHISEKLSTVYYVYKKMIESSAEEILLVNTYYTKLLTESETIGYRLASLICKTAVEPYDPYKGEPSNRLKSLLFVLLFNAAVESQESRQTIGSKNISDLKNQISFVLSNGTVQNRGGNFNADIQVADAEGRTFPISFDSDSQTSQRNVTVSNSSLTSTDYIKSVAGRVFSIDINKGLWKDIVDLLKNCYSSVFFVKTDNAEHTLYSGISKVTYMFAYFDMILRIIAAQTPENIVGSYLTTVSYSSSSTIRTKGLLISKPTKTQLNSYYNPYAFFYRLSVSSAVYKVKNAIEAIDSDAEILLRKTEVVKNFLMSLFKSVRDFRDYLSRNFSSHLSVLNEIFNSDTSLNDQQKIALINSTLSYEQLKLFNYLSSEVQERIASPYEAVFSRFITSSGTPDIFPANETDLMSFEIFHKAFNSEEFYPAKGNNKKIITFGLPQKLTRSLYSSPPSFNIDKAMRQGIIRVKVYKLDKLYPHVAYKPLTYLFDTNRFTSRVMSNWQSWQSVGNDESYLLRMPSKIVTPSGDIIESDSFANDFKVDLYGNFLKAEDKLQIYKNHSKSFLLQEYMRWFSEVHFDESRFINYTGVDRDVKLVNEQYAQLLDSMRVKSQTTTTPQLPTTEKSVIGVFGGAPDGQSYYTPIENTSSKDSRKLYTLNMTSTTKSYFRNETFLQSSGNSILSRVFYPKKFDRVFSVMVDPDDFYVDIGMSNDQAIQRLVDTGALLEVSSVTSGETLYKHRDTSPNDVTFDEYFISIESYDYV